MAEHMLLGDAAPALLLLAVRGPLLVFVVPAGVLRACARMSPLRAALSGLLRPSVSLCIWTAAYAVWHIPTNYDFALRHPVVHMLEHASFFAAGLLVWSQLVDPARHDRLSFAQRLAYAGALFLLGQLLGDLLLLSRPLYPTYAAVAARPFGWSALEDQQVAGLVMMAEQLLTLGTCAFLLLRSLVTPLRPAFRAC
jgi:cytochrome c oxidase assembly factor CtaG